MLRRVAAIVASVVTAMAVTLATPSCGDTRLIPIVAYDASISVEVPLDNAQPIDVPMVDEAATDVQPPDFPPVDVPPIVCPTALVGYAAETGGTRGGAGGLEVTASTIDQLLDYAQQDVPLVIKIGTMIPVTDQIRVHSDKTIVGIARGAGLIGGGLNITGVRNVIISRLTISKALKVDAIGVNNSNHVWIDHCDLSSDRITPEGDATYDGLVDISHASDYVTLSWNIFHDHYRPSIVGHSNSDAAKAEDVGHLIVTYHHNWFARVTSNTPRVRFGTVHVFNNLYDDVDAIAIISQQEASVFVQANAFRNVRGFPITTFYEDSAQGFAQGFALAVDNLCLANCGDYDIRTMKQLLPPSYPYNPDSADSLPALMATCAGPHL